MRPADSAATPRDRSATPPIVSTSITYHLAELCVNIHASNVTAGWWSDLKTGASILKTRNRPEMLMLAVSEIAEAAQGQFGEPDDKLPHRPMYDVELADLVIRLLDQIGAEVSLGREMPDWSFLVSPDNPLSNVAIDVELRWLSRMDRLMVLVSRLAIAMEHYRKGRIGEYVETLGETVLVTFQIAAIDQIPLWEIIAEKREFNAIRADHKVENRQAEGGKAF